MKTTTDKIYAYLLQKYAMRHDLVKKHLSQRGYSPASFEITYWGNFIAIGAEQCGVRLDYRDCCGDSDLGSGWRG